MMFVNMCLLRCADAEQNLASLVTIAKRFKDKLETMQENVHTQFKNINKLSQILDNDERNATERSCIEKVKSLQIYVTGDYKQHMAEISQKCIKIMGPPPYKYTLVEMGSLARNKITQYLDFEHIVICTAAKLKSTNHEQR